MKSLILSTLILSSLTHNISLHADTFDRDAFKSKWEERFGSNSNDPEYQRALRIFTEGYNLARNLAQKAQAVRRSVNDFGILGEVDDSILSTTIANLLGVKIDIGLGSYTAGTLFRRRHFRFGIGFGVGAGLNFLKLRQRVQSTTTKLTNPILVDSEVELALGVAFSGDSQSFLTYADDVIVESVETIERSGSIGIGLGIYLPITRMFSVRIPLFFKAHPPASRILIEAEALTTQLVGYLQKSEFVEVEKRMDRLRALNTNWLTIFENVRFVKPPRYEVPLSPDHPLSKPSNLFAEAVHPKHCKLKVENLAQKPNQTKI